MAAVVAVRHRVHSYEGWRPVYDEHGAVRKSHGCTGDTVLRDETDPNEILVLTYWPSLADAHAFASDPSMPEVMHRAGVAGAPRVEIYDEAGI
jgi:heme-degrading monooxygenase HmoA